MPEYAGESDYPELRSFVINDITLALGDSSVLPDEQDEEEVLQDRTQQYEKLTKNIAQLEIPFVILRGKDEKNALAEAEWFKALGYIFGKPEKGEELYRSVIEKASPEEIEEALEQLQK